VTGAAPGSPLAALWPHPAEVRAVRVPRGPGSDYLAVPSTRSPRLLVPTDVPGADRMLARHGGGWRHRLARIALRAAHRSGLVSWVPMPRLRVTADPSGIEQHVAAVLGRPVRVGVLLGPPRANLKPVLQVFDHDGTVLAFAKVATSSLTRSLLENEAAALRLLGGQSMQQVVSPALLDLGAWRDVLVLVQQALPSAQSGRQPTTLPTAALAEIATVAGLRGRPLEGSKFWHRAADVGPARWHGLDVSSLSRLVAAVDPRWECLFGAWHGDFGPWNAARGDGALEVWDWERFDADVPAGLDAAHWRMQVDQRTDPASTWRAMRADVAAVLHEVRGTVGTSDTTAADATAACYLLTIWARYRHDAATSLTPALRARVAWLCRLADAALPTLTTTKDDRR
jgi:hypothetical protein